MVYTLAVANIEIPEKGFIVSPLAGKFFCRQETLGKTVFLTREKAEAKLNELEAKNNG